MIDLPISPEVLFGVGSVVSGGVGAALNGVLRDRRDARRALTAARAADTQEKAVDLTALAAYRQELHEEIASLRVDLRRVSSELDTWKLRALDEVKQNGELRVKVAELSAALERSISDREALHAEVEELRRLVDRRHLRDGRAGRRDSDGAGEAAE